MGEAIDIFKQFIRQRGLRYTPERETVVREVFRRPDHFDVDELHLALRRRPGNTVSRASVYRTLPLLIEAGLIREIYHEDGHRHYEPCLGEPDHCHLRCQSCRRTVDFDDPAVLDLGRGAARDQGFTITGHRIELFGLCPDCRANTATPPAPSPAGGK